jgi:hypothetical protein
MEIVLELRAMEVCELDLSGAGPGPMTDCYKVRQEYSPYNEGLFMAN